MINNNFSPGIVIFYGESPEDLALMPTTTKAGQGKYDYGFAPKGSLAEILLEDEKRVYMLRSNGWVEITDTQILSLF